MVRTLALALLLLGASCNDSSRAPDNLLIDLSAALDGNGPLPACGLGAPCGVDQICVLISLRPSSTGCGSDGGPCNSYECVALPPACAGQRTCTCVDAASSGNFCSTLRPKVMCLPSSVQGADIICTST